MNELVVCLEDENGFANELILNPNEFFFSVVSGALKLLVLNNEALFFSVVSDAFILLKLNPD